MYLWGIQGDSIGFWGDFLGLGFWSISRLIVEFGFYSIGLRRRYTNNHFIRVCIPECLHVYILCSAAVSSEFL